MTRPMPEPPEKYQILGQVIIVWEGGSGYYYHPSLMDSKRLTDAECAAEFWRAESDEQFNAATNPDDEHAADAYRYIRATWHRFATHPHALEGETRD